MRTSFADSIFMSRGSRALLGAVTQCPARIVSRRGMIAFTIACAPLWKSVRAQASRTKSLTRCLKAMRGERSLSHRLVVAVAVRHVPPRSIARGLGQRMIGLVHMGDHDEVMLAARREESGAHEPALPPRAADGVGLHDARALARKAADAGVQCGRDRAIIAAEHVDEPARRLAGTR